MLAFFHLSFDHSSQLGVLIRCRHCEDVSKESCVELVGGKVGRIAELEDALFATEPIHANLRSEGQSFLFPSTSLLPFTSLKQLRT